MDHIAGYCVIRYTFMSSELNLCNAVISDIKTIG